MKCYRIAYLLIDRTNDNQTNVISFLLTINISDIRAMFKLILMVIVAAKQLQVNAIVV